MPQGDGRHKTAGDAIGAYLRALERGLADVEGRLDGVNFHFNDDDFALLDRALDVHDKFREKGRDAARMANAWTTVAQ